MKSAAIVPGHSLYVAEPAHIPTISHKGHSKTGAPASQHGTGKSAEKTSKNTSQTQKRSLSASKPN
jgi:hypothetical protein